ncbi:MAG: hypothetical protein C4346_14860, partial [Chloroflexota bacterium]
METARHVLRLGSKASWSALVLGLALVGGNAAITASAYPYYLSAYNPLLGGNKAAQHVMMIGWGEGLDQVGRFLGRQGNAAGLRVRTSAWPQPLSYFFPGHIWEDNFTPDTAGVVRWATTDFYVLDITSLQRGWIPPALLAYLDEQRPVFTARVGGTEYARVFDVRTLPLPDYFLTPATGMTDWNGALRIAAVDIGSGRVLRGDRAPVAVYVTALGTPVKNLALRVRIVSPGGQEIAS